jgi:hypothetical protein
MGKIDREVLFHEAMDNQGIPRDTQLVVIHLRHIQEGLSEINKSLYAIFIILVLILISPHWDAIDVIFG